MRLGAEDLVYHPGAGGLGAEFHEDSCAVLVSAAYQGREIQAVYGLRHD